MIRAKLVTKPQLALAPVLAGLLAALPASAAGGPATKGTTATGASPRHRLALIAPLAAPGPLTAAAVATASGTCVRYATQVGWAGNGYFAGDLVTAAAICVAESHGDPNLIVCDENGSIVGHGDFPGFTCPAGTTSEDRGLWQLNNKVPRHVSDTCAFNPVCNAHTAYLASSLGTSFVPWTSYDQDLYARDIDPVQIQVTKLTSGTVTSAELGSCLVQGRRGAGARVVIANCGSGALTQQWSITGGKLRAGRVCAAIASIIGTPGVVLARCARTKRQKWTVFGRYELRNAADGLCLTDPAGSLTKGTQVRVTRCANAKDQTWWLP